MGERKPLLIVVAGPNGSGKTTITAKVLHHEWMEDSYYINPVIRCTFTGKAFSRAQKYDF